MLRYSAAEQELKLGLRKLPNEKGNQESRIQASSACFALRLKTEPYLMRALIKCLSIGARSKMGLIQVQNNTSYKCQVCKITGSKCINKLRCGIHLGTTSEFRISGRITARTICSHGCNGSGSLTVVLELAVASGQNDTRDDAFPVLLSSDPSTPESCMLQCEALPIVVISIQGRVDRWDSAAETVLIPSPRHN